MKRTDAIKKVGELISHIKIAMLITENAEGELHSRPMMTQEQEFDGDLWFFAENDSEKVQEIERNPSLNATYADGSRFISVAGQAHIVSDVSKKKELWFDALRVWFEAGPESPDVVLIHVDPSSAQYWETPSGILGKAASMVNVLLTGDTEAAGENEKVRL